MTPEQCRAARALLNLTQPRLAELAGFGLSTVVDFEKGRRSIPPATVAAIKAALEQAGVQFLPSNGHGPGVALSKPGA